jgi:hypothetical protein
LRSRAGSNPARPLQKYDMITKKEEQTMSESGNMINLGINNERLKDGEEINYENLRDWVIKRLLHLPDEIGDVERGILHYSVSLDDAKADLAEKEAVLIKEGKVEGKNEQQRKASLMSQTTDERQEIRELEKQIAKAKLLYNYKMNEFSSSRSLAKLLPPKEVK